MFYGVTRKPIVRIWPNLQGFSGFPLRLRFRQNLTIWFGDFEGGGGKEKSLTPIFSPLEGPGAPKFFTHEGLSSPYQSAKNYESNPYGDSPKHSRLFQKILGGGYLHTGFWGGSRRQNVS